MILTVIHMLPQSIFRLEIDLKNIIKHNQKLVPNLI